MPIYEGTSDEVLMQGIGHLQKTSLPIGGNDTNSVLVGHTGITAKTFFDNLNKMKIKDTFYIYILDDVLKYEVKEIKTVLPDDTESIGIVEGEELVTLVTCTPKYINSHRLLVIGERIQEAKENDKSFFTKAKKRNISSYLSFFSKIYCNFRQNVLQ